MCEIIGMITEIVSNQYHLLVLIRKVIALQRLFNFCDYSHSLQSTFPGFLFPLGYGGLKRVLACKFVFFSVFPQFSKLWVSNWYHSLVSFRLKNRLGKSDYSFQKSDTWTRIH